MLPQVLLVLLITMLLVIFVLILPVKLAAEALGAQRTNVVWCFLSLLGASVMQSIGLSIPLYGSIVAFLLSSAAFAAVLGTSFLKGIGIAVLHIIFAAAILFAIAALFGMTLAGLVMVL